MRAVIVRSFVAQTTSIQHADERAEHDTYTKELESVSLDPLESKTADRKMCDCMKCLEFDPISDGLGIGHSVPSHGAQVPYISVESHLERTIKSEISIREISNDEAAHHNGVLAVLRKPNLNSN